MKQEDGMHDYIGLFLYTSIIYMYTVQCCTYNLHMFVKILTNILVVYILAKGGNRLQR